MKRRAISFITALALCLSLCPMRALAVDGEPEAANAAMVSAYGADSEPGGDYKLSSNTTITGTRTVKTSIEYILNGYSYTSSTATVFKIEGTGALYLKTDGKVESANGAGIEAATGGFLLVEAQNITIAGTTYGLDISSGATVQLSGGTYTGGTAAIRASGYGALLKDGCAFFDESGKPVPLTEMAGKKTVTVKMCTDHLYWRCTPNDGVPTHNGTCRYCGTKAFAGSCTFDFDNGGNQAKCDDCGRTLKIDVTVDDLTYNGTDKAASVAVAVTIDGGKPLICGTDYDYTVEPSSRADVGDFTVTVTGITYSGTYTETYSVTRARPVLTWAEPAKSVDYDGRPVEKDVDLPKVNIKAPRSEDLVDLLVFSYREKDSGADFTDGLPTDAGTYEIKARLPGQENYEEAETENCLELTVNKINPIKNAPEAIKNLVYNHSAQNLVTSGEVWDGAVILFALDMGKGVADSDYSEAIPTGINADKYNVLYKVDGSSNYTYASGFIPVTIARKEITPDVKLEYTSCVYDGGEKEPTVTVTDPEDNWELPSTEYTVDYDNNQDVSTAEDPAKVTVKNAEGGNYTVITVEREFKITAANQGALAITKTPDKVVYGDVFTLEAVGGSGNGTVTWEITAINGSAAAEKQSTVIADIDPASGQVTVTGVGTVTVRATKSGETNHENATAEWTFTAGKRPVTATVTAENKPYDGKANTKVYAVVEQGTVFNDEIKITMPDGTFGDVNAGTNKSVTVVTEGATIKVNNEKETNFDTGKKHFDTGNYIVTFSSAPVTADITPKEVTLTVELDPEDPENPGSGYKYTGKAIEPTVKVKATYEEKNETGTETKSVTLSLTQGTDYTVTYSNNVNVGTAAVTVRAKAGGNYTFPDQTVTFSIRGGAILTGSPTAKDLTYTGQPQELVTVGTATGGQLVYALAKTGDKTAEGAGDDPTGAEADDKPEEKDYKAEIPKETNAGLYKVYYKVKAEGSYEDTAPAYVFVTIKPKTVLNPDIGLDLTPDNFNVYDGRKKEPEVTSVKDGDTVIWQKGTDGNAEDKFIITYDNNVNVGTAIVHIISRTDGNYYVDGSTTFEIKQATAKFADGKEPKANEKLVYKGKPLELVTPGTAEGGTAVYSSNGENGTYKPEIPTEDSCGRYTVWAKVLGDANHEDSTPIEIQAAIVVNKVEELTVELSSTSFRYNGKEQKPTVTVKDDDGDVISDDQYSEAYLLVTEGTNAPIAVEKPTDVGTYKIKITADGNYSFSEEREFTITPAEQTPLRITEKPNVVYYGNEFQLKTEGGLDGVTVEWSIEEGENGRIEKVTGEDGKFKITGTGRIIIKAAKKAANYEDVTDTWEFYAEKRPLTVTGVTPKKGADGNPLIYDGSAQALVFPGDVEGMIAGDTKETVGTVVYSLDNITYGGNIPTGTDAGTYIVWYKAIAKSANYADSGPTYVEVEIAKKKIEAEKLTVTCSPSEFPYDGTQKTPDIIVTYREGEGGSAQEFQIPASEYTVTFDPPMRMKTGKYTATVTAKSDGNYTFTGGDVTGTFEILPSAPLSIVTDRPADVYYGDTFTLRTAGGVEDGNIAWKITDEEDRDGSKVTARGTIAAIDQATGKVTVNGVGSFTVTVTKGEAAEGSGDAYNTASITFTANPKPVTAVVTAKDKVYNGWTSAALTVTVPADGITITVNPGIVGRFDSADVGTNKTVTFTITESDVTVGGNKKDNYAITYPITGTTTASITPADVDLTGKTVPEGNDSTYNGSAQPLLIAGDTLDGGSWVYSVDGSNYSLTIPTAVYAGNYIVKYKVLADSNHKDSEEKSVTVTIDKATPEIIVYPKAEPVKYGDPLSESELTGGKAICDGVEVPGAFTWMNPAYMPAITTKREAVFTPYDKTNYHVVEGIKITVEVIKGEDSSGGDDTGDSTGTPEEPATEFTPPQTSVQNGVAIADLTAEAGDELVNEAVANESRNIVIKPEITGDVTKTEVSLPASTVGRISSETDAALTVSTPIAIVTIPNAALDTLSSAGSAVSVVTEQVENTVVLTLTADGKDMGDIPGGLTLTVPVEDIGPGTVAVLVYEDGTRETIRKSVAEDSGVRIPLNGSATVEIVDNSREFADVPAESWAADAVAFASAHELFNGTSETTFSPELTMSRAMLATVLYNLEGRPDQGMTNGEFSDVNSGTWYTEGVSWAAENGIVSGYGDGQFGPNDSITREQLAVMLWRYAGSPAADEQTLDFADADQVSSYAVEALCWAIANGLMRGPGGGLLDPGGITTRAQAAQMLKNFLENT